MSTSVWCQSWEELAWQLPGPQPHEDSQHTHTHRSQERSQLGYSFWFTNLSNFLPT